MSKFLLKLTIAWIGKTKEPAIQQLSDKYLDRLAHYADVQANVLKDEKALLQQGSRPKHFLIALDSRGKQFSSEGLAEFLAQQQDRAVSMLFAVGAADGFSDRVLQSADLILSLGKMTLPHELARIVLLEQLYRAFTILRGHPYHSGH